MMKSARITLLILTLFLALSITAKMAMKPICPCGIACQCIPCGCDR